ncbi:MAG TPA: ABC transporter permease [Acidimicrobiales bacterium]|nr:ABC transporter permease [Acidimicrobiales bacterium]
MSLATQLPAGSSRRKVVVAVALVAALFVFTQLVLPGSGAGRGTPAAILFGGLVAGLVNALTATGLILLYRTQRIINFAQASLGVAGAVLVFEFVRYTAVPFPIAFVLGLALAGGVGFLAGLLALRFASAPRLVLTVFTILVAVFLAELSQSVAGLPFFPPADERTSTEFLGIGDIQAFLPFPGLSFQVGDLPITFGFAHLFAIYVSVFALLALAAFFRFTRAGIAVRGLAENRERAALLGISVGGLSCTVWALSGVLAGASVTLTGALVSPGAATGFAPAILLPALAAAVLGRMRSLPITVAAAVGLSIFNQAMLWSLDDSARSIVQVTFFLVIAVGLFTQRRTMLRSEDGDASSWEATEETRPIPVQLAAIPGVRFTRYALIFVGLAVLVLYPFVVSAGAQNLGGVIALQAIVVLSLIVLTGWAGQVSLGQFAFVAIGAVVGGALSGRVGIPFWFAAPMAAAVTGALAAAVGVPALRVKGLMLLVSTFAFAVAVRAVLFEERFFGWLLPGTVPRPRLLVFDFDDERSMYFLCLASLLLAVVVVVNLRRSRFGRVLIALRENEANAQAFGVSALRMKLLAFGVSGGMAGFAGAVLATQAGAVTADSFGVQASIDVFIISIFGGVSSIPGALLGTAYFLGLRFFFTNALFLAFLTVGIPLYLLYVAPGGLASLIVKLRDAVLRIVAQRRQLVVPSLFDGQDTDDPDSLLIPLGEPLPGAGLSVVGARRYTADSELYGSKATRTATVHVAADTAALGAAAQAMSDLELERELDDDRTTVTEGAR